ncbi:MAG: chloride channel protein [Lachnospiraceae bacterium]|nr:chloride channel protein [Lachnospiraceae bacterium]
MSAKWVVFSIISGIVVGTTGTLFYFSMSFVTKLRGDYPWILYFLPIGGLLIVGAYRFMHDENDTGTNLVLSAIHSGDHLPLKMAPLIFISTLITHLCGGSAGREGAALQLGGSIGNGIGRLFRFDEKDKHIMIMCGMSAAFSALFGTPMAAAIFSMEVVSVGIMHYSALVPCVVAALIAHGIAINAGASAETFIIEEIPSFRVETAVIISVLAIICAVVSIVFCVMLHQSEYFYKKIFKNPYIRIAAGGCFIIILTLLVGDQSYNGTGINVIERCFDGTVRPEAFFMKMLFTALTLGAGFKGGEIVPSFFTGAAFGCLFGNLIGFSSTLCSAVGMTAVFCGVTNCPITSLLISFELFGYEGMPYFLLAVAFSYMLSGYFGLYHSQKIMYSKYKTNYINKKTQ